MQDNVSPMPTTAGNNEPTLDSLADKFQDAKMREANAKAERIHAEEEMVQLELVERHAEENGSKTTNGETYKVTVKDEKKAKCGDWEGLSAICRDAELPSDDWPIKWTASVDVKALDKIKAERPELYLELCEVIERYPAKPSFTVKRIGS